MITTTFIYVLKDPRTGCIRYVGKADNPSKRWKCHCWISSKKSHKNSWVSELKNLGLLPELEILEQVPLDEWEEIEREYIRVFRMVGMNLTNQCDGGEGVVGLSPSKETREKMSRAAKGKKRPKISDALRGKKRKFFNRRSPSEETREKISAAQRGKQISGYTRLKMSLAHSGKKLSEETRKKMSLIRKGCKFSTHHCKNLSISKLGKKRGPYKKKDVDNAKNSVTV